jgi:hypothetical protein
MRSKRVTFMGYLTLFNTELFRHLASFEGEIKSDLWIAVSSLLSQFPALPD